jgi:hypothetical protein
VEDFGMVKRIFIFSLAAVLLIICSTIAKAENVYFLVAEFEPYYCDSYVLPLSNPTDIAHARGIIQGGPGPYIVVAGIAATANGINRDYLDINKREWHWHVTRFNAFADMTAEILDGWPGGAELGYNVGTIGFWSYSVVAELGTDPKHWDRDFVNDGQIDYEDFAVFAQNWRSTGCTVPDWCGGTDFNKSGTVDLRDLRVFAESWLSPFAEAPAEEIQ